MRKKYRILYGSRWFNSASGGGDFLSWKNKWEEDISNDRIVAYFPEISEQELEKLREEKEKQSKGKIIVYTLIENSKELSEMGFKKETSISDFFAGQTTHIYSLFINPERQKSSSVEKNNEVLNIVNRNRDTPSSQWDGITFQPVHVDQLSELSLLFKKVFQVYPTNIFDPTYIKTAIETDYLFIVAMDGSNIIGAASAMRTNFGSAEITDCAVNPEYRGKNILHGIVLELEKKLVEEGIVHAFSITRAKSVGMNMTVKRLAYKYEGTLTNNCQISTGYEDMNIWTKKLK